MIIITERSIIYRKRNIIFKLSKNQLKKILGDMTKHLESVTIKLIIIILYRKYFQTPRQNMQR